MKLLHTSDWHLGHKLLHRDREEEHQLALKWLLELIEKEQIDLLLVAGDIFDISNPPNTARRMYYHFLTEVLKTSCKHVVITGGNHDSPSMLEAPKDLLSNFNIFVCGAAGETFADQLFPIKNTNGKIEALVAAVPFLRDRDLIQQAGGEGGLERIERIRQGIADHYQALAAYVEANYNTADIPVITTGHLYASGAEATAKQNNIYIGDQENIKSSQFPDLFDYVALGHIHRAQKVGGEYHIRYSGSIIPLSFSETKDEKGVYILEFKGKQLDAIKFHNAPVGRRLKTIEGSLEEVELKLRSFDAKERHLTPWVEVIVDTDRIIPRLDLQFREMVKNMDLELLKVRIENEYSALDNQVSLNDLDTLDIEDVFKRRCESFGTAPDEMEQLQMTFRELINWIDQQEAQ